MGTSEHKATGDEFLDVEIGEWGSNHEIAADAKQHLKKFFQLRLSGGGFSPATVQNRSLPGWQCRWCSLGKAPPLHNAFMLAGTSVGGVIDGGMSASPFLSSFQNTFAPEEAPANLPFVWDEGTLRNATIQTLQTDMRV